MASEICAFFLLDYTTYCARHLTTLKKYVFHTDNVGFNSNLSCPLGMLIKILQ